MSTMPAYFNDNLSNRADYHRFRNIGNPFSFLQNVGIDPILEQIYQGNNVVDVAKKLNVGVGMLLAWLESSGNMQAVENATVMSAEGYLSNAAEKLSSARSDFELKKAKELAAHGRFMASKLDKTKYGTDNSKLGNATGVTFIMHMGDKTAKITTSPTTDNATSQYRPNEVQALEGTYRVLLPADTAMPDDIGPFEDAPFVPQAEALPAYLKPLNTAYAGAADDS